jgi:hypothetical protein
VTLTRRELLTTLVAGGACATALAGPRPAPEPVPPAPQADRGRLHIVNGWVLTDADLVLLGLDAG